MRSTRNILALGLAFCALAPLASAQPPVEPTAVLVKLAPNGRMDVEGEATPVARLGLALSVLARQDRDAADFVLDLEVDPTLPMAELQAYQDEFVAAGHRRVRYLVDGQKIPFLLGDAERRKEWAEVEESRKIRVNLDATGETTLGGDAVASTDLGREVASRLRADSEGIVVIETSPDTPAGDYLEAFAAVHDAGALRIVLTPTPQS